ncbi:MAG: SurA N-terminal domain-containing protein, partial [Pyrinomonadaceae bacterium]|nr:SurA N-terminal domain-containing protein [Pyrinomonadaceae bacterium]
MLKQLSRLEKTRNIVLLAFVILMAVSLVFFYAPRQNERIDNLGRSQETVATVGSETITLGQVATTRANIEKRNEAQSAQYGGQFKIPAPPIKSVLDGEISQALIRQEARRLNLMPTDDEVAATIR